MLNPRQQKFAELIVAGQTAKAAYFEAFPRCRTEGTAEANGARLLGNAKVAEFIEALRWETGEKVKSNLIASKTEVAEFLTSVLRTPAGSIDEEHQLCQAFKFTKGERSLKIPDKIKAADSLAKLLGYNQPEKVEVTGDVISDILAGIRSGKGRK